MFVLALLVFTPAVCTETLLLCAGISERRLSALCYQFIIFKCVYVKYGY